jgi:tetratricopeptide (TPR) repeat protein
MLREGPHPAALEIPPTMRRDTFVFTLAGVAFGLVVGYMAASWGLVPRPAVPGPAAAAAGSAGSSPARGAGRLDADEVKAMESLAARQPDDVGVRVELGNLYMDHHRWDEAIRWYREALARNAGLADVAVDLGACLVNAGRPAEGLQEFDGVLAHDPGHRNALYNKGIALLKLGRQKDAVAVWEDLLKRHPDDPQLAGLRTRIEQLRGGLGS